MPHPLHAPAFQTATSNIPRRFAANSVLAIAPQRKTSRRAVIANTVRALPRVVRKTTQSLPLMDLKHSNPLVILWMFEEGEAISGHVGNEPMSAPCRVRYGDVESPWVKTRISGVSPHSLVTFFAPAPRRKSPWGTKKVTAAPHRGNASAA